MHEGGKSDRPVVPEKPANDGHGAPRPEERVEERGLTKGNSGQRTRTRTQSRQPLQDALTRVRQAALKDREQRFTTLWHHVYNHDRLREAYFSLKPNAAPGVDGVTWRQYGERLESNLADLHGRLKRGAYRARPVRRARVPKEDGRDRLIGIPALEDKIVQRAASEVIGAVFEADFLGFSYGFRPGRSQHNALDALTVGIERKRVNWILDADIRGFFDTIDRDWLMKFVEHRIADRRVLRHIKKWLRAGVWEDGKRTRTKEGTPQGGSISPLLGNIFLHYVFDLWVQSWRQRKAQGDLIVVRFADDFVVGFQHRADAEQFHEDLRRRLCKFNLELHPEKTRLIEFGRFAAKNRARRGQGKPETFDFLGLTHICGRTRQGKFRVARQTMKKRLRRKLKLVKAELRRRMHDSVPEVGAWLRSVITGHANYYGVPGNGRALFAFRSELARLWRRALRRRSQKTRLSWARFGRLRRRWLPYPHITHPWPDQRLRVIT